MANVAKMERQIKELTNVETFYDDVREIVGYYNPNVFIEDCGDWRKVVWKDSLS